MKLPTPLDYVTAMRAAMPMACYLLGQAQMRALYHPDAYVRAAQPLDRINAMHMARLWAATARNYLDSIHTAAARDHGRR